MDKPFWVLATYTDYKSKAKYRPPTIGVTFINIITQAAVGLLLAQKYD